MRIYAEIDIPNRIKPLYNSDYDTLKKVKKGTPVRIEIVQERNYLFHKKVMALFNLGYENQEKINNFDHYRSLMTIRAGFYDSYETKKGTFVIAKSISFANMDQSTFEDLFNRLLDVISKELESEPEVIRLQIEDFY